MKRFYPALLAFIAIISACNIDKVIVSDTPKGEYYRYKTSSSSKFLNTVYEYTPAPGQFINELKTSGFDGTQTTPEMAILYAENRLMNNKLVSLGGFGGYIIVGFDHSIDNNGDYDFAIKGNSNETSSEPGIVYVMQDENGDGLPNDVWYELAGSETGKSETIKDYAVTYYRPEGVGMSVQWSDNMGNRGEIDYNGNFHNQEYYYPLWIKEKSYTLSGTRLEARNYDKSGDGAFWVNPPYDWGYADNFSSIDRLQGDNANYFKISDAIKSDGSTADLKYIDFIKVQTAVNGKSGWTGEISTEILTVYDCSMK